MYRHDEMHFNRRMSIQQAKAAYNQKPESGMKRCLRPLKISLILLLTLLLLTVINGVTYYVTRSYFCEDADVNTDIQNKSTIIDSSVTQKNVNETNTFN